MANILPLVIMLPLMYVLLIRPQKKRADQQRQLVNSVAEGAEVMTASGIYGFVHAVEDDIIWLEISDGVIIRVSKQAIGKVTPAAAGSEVDDVPAGGEPRTDDPDNLGDNSEKG
jgi:preprotein translocase subunit YajC